jgi:type IV secretory pathway VirB2 component (pilin)
VGVIIAGALLAGGSDRAALNLSWVVTVVLLFVSLRNSWDLLVSLGEVTMGSQAEKPG